MTNASTLLSRQDFICDKRMFCVKLGTLKKAVACSRNLVLVFNIYIF